MVGLGERLQALRCRNGWTQAYVGLKTGVTSVTISAYELNNRTPEIKTLIKLAKLYHISVDALLGVDKDMIAEKTICVEGLSEENISLIQALVQALRKG